MAKAMFELVIGDKAWSSWSLRPWIAMKMAGIPFSEVHIRLRQDDTKSQILKHSPSGQVPALKWRGEIISDSLAICETLADLYPEKELWPADPMARAFARSISAQMHSGFIDLRRDMPMDVLHTYPGEGHSETALAAIRRVVEIWRYARLNFGRKVTGDEGFLFGKFTIADAMYAPVASRFQTYAVDLSRLGDSAEPQSGIARDYVKTILSTQAYAQWFDEAEIESAARD